MGELLPRGLPSRAWAVLVPVALVLCLVGFRRMSDRTLPRSAAEAVFAVVALGLLEAISLGAWSVLARSQRRVTASHDSDRRQTVQLEALSEAALALTADLDLDSLLQRIVDLSRQVIGSRYGALAVVGPGGLIESFLTAGIDAETRARLGPPPVGHGLLGVVISERQVLRLDDLASDPRSVGFPGGHPAMRSLLAVPIEFESEVVGSLYLTERDGGGGFSEGDERILKRFAAQAAVAVANARLYRTAQRVSVVEERQRIAMDLHDGVMQSLYASSLTLEGCTEQIEADPEGVRQTMNGVVDQLSATISDIRRYVQGLRAEQRRSDLAETLQRLLDSLEAGPELSRQLLVSGTFDDIPQQGQWELWHVAHEALSNAVRHGEPRHIDIHLSREGGRVRMAIQDNGRGFDVRSGRRAGHDGLQNMQRRVEALGGQFTVISAPERGTTVLVDVPATRGVPVDVG